MTNAEELQNIIGRTAVDRDGKKVGKIGQIYLDDDSGSPRWVTISTGLFGTNESFAPIRGYRHDGDNILLDVTKDQVKDAPNMDADSHLDAAENDRLHAYYAASFSGDSDTDTGWADTSYRDESNAAGAAASSGMPGRDVGVVDIVGRATRGDDTSGLNTNDAVTSREEPDAISSNKAEGARARLRRYVVTENVTVTVPVSHDEVSVKREPISNNDISVATSAHEISEDEREVILYSEQPVVRKETVAVERVRLNTETVTGNEEIAQQVRKEQAEPIR